MELFLVILFIGIILWGLNSKRRPMQKSVWRKRYPNNIVQTSELPRDASAQLKLVMSARFTVQPVLNKSESIIFQELEHLVQSRNPNWQVMAQVSLGEILRCSDKEAFLCINSKRVDFLLMDNKHLPRHAIEYQGKGHHQSEAAARDAVKKEALRRAGIGYYEVIAGETTRADIRRLIEKIVTIPNQKIDSQ